MAERRTRKNMTGIRKWRRVHEMSGKERVYRIRERLRVELDRLLAHAGTNNNPKALTRTGRRRNPMPANIEDSRSSVLDYLRGGPAGRFYFNCNARLQLAGFVKRNFPAWADAAAGEADRLCRHRVSLLGFGDVSLGANINWHKDPLTGRSWDKLFWADYDPVREHEAGDPKTIHELNRHHHIARLAKAFFLTGQERYALEAVGQIESWIDQNPPLTGINWQSCLEIALRSIAWMWSLFFLLPSRALDESAARRIVSSLFTQVEHVCRFPSYYSSPNTHLIGEATALFVAGIVFQDHSRAKKWLSVGREILITEMERQVTAEGVHGELSSCYHCYTLDFYLQALVLARHSRVVMPDRLWEKTSLMIDFLMHLTRPDGTMPLLGDDDGGRALALGRSDYGSFSDCFSTGAVLFRRPDYRTCAGSFREETLWLLGEQAWNVFESLPFARPASATLGCPEAGYFIQRTGWGRDAAQLVFDCGELGKLGGGHGHADALSFTLWSAGRDLLVDPGTFVYNGAPEWRDYFRSTRAHNTVTIDGHGQSEADAPFHWERKANTRILEEFDLPDIMGVAAEHDGYTQLNPGLIHHRRLLFIKSGYWVLADSFRGTGKHHFEHNLHFSADVELSISRRHGKCENQLQARSGAVSLHLAFIAGVPVDARIIRGSGAPIQGWVSGRYGQKAAAPVLCSSFVCSAPSATLTAILPANSVPGLLPAGCLRSLEINGGAAVGCAITLGRQTDLFIVSQEAAEVTAAGFRLAGEFFWIRSSNNVPRKFLALEASHMSIGNKIIFDHRDPAPFLSADIRSTEGSGLESSQTSEHHVRNLRDHSVRIVQAR